MVPFPTSDDSKKELKSGGEYVKTPLPLLYEIPPVAVAVPFTPLTLKPALA